MQLDMNLVPVYEELNYTGRGVRVAIIDDGLEYTHDDLKDNYVSVYDYSFCELISVIHLMNSYLFTKYSWYKI